MKTGAVIAGVGALVVVVGGAMLTRYDYMPVNGRLVRVDRWTGKAVAATREKPNEFDYLAKKGRAVPLPPEELARVQVEGRFDAGDQSPLAVNGPKIVLQVNNGSAYTVEWLDVDAGGERLLATGGAGIGAGAQPGGSDTFTAPLSRGAAVRGWRVVAAHGYPPKR